MSTLGFLLSDTARLLRRRYDERARTIGVTRAQWRALTALSRNEGINQVALAEQLEVEAITACRMIDRLEEAGLVERRRSPSDRRAWHIYLAPKALPLLEQLRALGEEVTEHAFDGFSDTERARLADALERLRSNLLDTVPQHQEAANG